MRIPSGSSSHYVYFVAVDATDQYTRETGLSGKMVVARSRNGGTMSLYTTPTINETDTGDMTGIYELLIDEDTTITAGNESEEYCIQIVDTGGHMAPVTRVIELFQNTVKEIEDTGINSRFDNIPNAVWDEQDTGHADTGTFGRLRATVTKLSAGVHVSSISDTGMTDRFDDLDASVGAIGASSGGALNFSNEADNVDTAIKSVSFVGVETSGTNASVNAEDGTYHQIDDTTNAIDIVYQFDIGGGRAAASATFKGYVSGANDTITVQAYNGSTWDTRTTITGQAGSTNQVIDIPLLATHTGTGSDIGLVFLRFVCSGQSNPTLYIDELLVQAVSIGQSTGYSGGFVYYDSDASNTNTEAFVDGTADNPVSSWSAVKSILSSVGLTKVDVVGDLQLDATAEGIVTMMGHRATLRLGGQEIGDVEFENFKSITDSGATSSARPVFTRCILGDTGRTFLPPSLIQESTLRGDITSLSSGEWDIINSTSGVAGLGAPTIDLASTNQNTVGISNWNRSLTLSGLDTGDDVSAHGTFSTLTLNGGAATVSVQGQYGTLANNLTGTPVVQASSSFATSGAAGYFGSVWVDESNGVSSGTIVNYDGTFQRQSDDFDNAQSIADSLGTGTITIHPGNSITLTSALQGYTVNNVQATLNGGSQNVDSTRINGGFVTGTFSRAGSGVPTLNICSTTNLTSDRIALLGCGIIGTMTMTEAGLYVFVDCQAAGPTGVSTLDFDSLGGATANFERWTGNLTIANMASGDTLNLHCTSGGNIVIGGADGTVNISGVVGSVTDNRTGSPSLSDNYVKPNFDVNVASSSDTGLNLRLDIIEAHTDTGIQTGLTASLDTGAVNQAVWQADGARTLTAFALDTGIADTVWKYSSRVLTANTNLSGLEVSVTQLSDTGIEDRLDKIQSDTDTGLKTGLQVTATALSDTGLNDRLSKIQSETDTGLRSALASASALTTVDTVVDAIKAKTDSLTFTQSGVIDANILYVNSTQITGNGDTGAGTTWGPA